MSLTKWLIWGRKTKSKRIKRFINWFIRRYYACEINCDTRIDESVKFPHGGLGVMINTHCIIGKNVSIFPGAKLVVTKYNGPHVKTTHRKFIVNADDVRIRACSSPSRNVGQRPSSRPFTGCAWAVTLDQAKGGRCLGC